MTSRLTPDDAAWFREQIERHERSLVTYAGRLLGDPERARDAVQDSFLRLFEERRRDVEGYVTEWLYTVTRRRCVDLWRKENGAVRFADGLELAASQHMDDPVEIAARADAHARVLGLLGCLSANQREVIQLRFAAELSYREIAAITELTVTNVGYLLSTGLGRLRELLGVDRTRELAQ